MDEPPVLRMRTASGTVVSDDPLVMFLYLLARDKLPIGAIDQIIDYEIPKGDHERAKGAVPFTNGWLAEWAKDAAKRLNTEQPSFWEQLPDVIMLKDGLQIRKNDIRIPVTGEN